MTTDYRVYKVLDNNGGTAYSGSAPTSESTAPFELGGYVLQYMYSLTSSEVEKYLTTDFMPVSTDATISAAASDGAIDTLKVTGGSGYTDGTYYAAVYGDGTSAGGASGAIVRITVASGAIQAFGLTAGTDTTVHAAGTGYTYGTVNLATGYTFSDATLATSAAMGGSGGSIEVIISPKGGHGSNATRELFANNLGLTVSFADNTNRDLILGNDFKSLDN